MSHEILYTSAPRLLKPGMTGYGTVVSTRGISSHLADKLESLSGYRWAFEQGDPQARLNPVCHSHLVITVAGQKYHVLSRVADYGADYSGRSNKIAHHVALSESELTPGGPGWVLKSPGFCETRWNEQLKNIEAGRQPTRSVRDSADYSVWKHVMGDAGWAGILAETVGSTDRRAVHVIFPLGTDTLELVEESLNLLPHRDRWNVSFSTYYNVLPASVDCHWRFVLDGTPEATNLRRQPHQRIIDLCRLLGPAIGGELVQRARNGWQPAFGPPSHAPVNAPVPPQSTAAASQPRRTAAIASANRVDVDVPEPTGLAYSPPMPARYAASASGPRPPVKMGWRLPLWGTLLLCLLIGAAAGGAGFWLGRRSAHLKEENDTVGTTRAANGTPQRASEHDRPPTNVSDANDNTRNKGGVSRSAVDDPGSTVVANNRRSTKTPPEQTPLASHEPAIPAIPPTAPTTPLESVNYLELPDHVPGIQKDFVKVATTTKPLPEVIGADILLENDTQFPKLIQGDQTWKQMSSENNPIATFKSENGVLLFQWDRNAFPQDVSILRRCLLRLESSHTPIPMSKPFSSEGSLLQNKSTWQIDLSATPGLEDLEPCLAKLSLGEWSLESVPSEYVIAGIESPLTPAMKPKRVVFRIRKGDLDIATLEVSRTPKDSIDEAKPLAIVEIRLNALFPRDSGSMDDVHWSAGNRNSDKYSAEGISQRKGSMETTKKHAEDAKTFVETRWNEQGKVSKDGDQLVSGLDSFSKTLPATSNDRVQIEKMLNAKDKDLPPNLSRSTLVTEMGKRIKEYGDQLLLLEKQLTWRMAMDSVTSGIESKATFSFDVWYDCPVDESKPVRVTLGRVKAKLPSLVSPTRNAVSGEE